MIDHETQQQAAHLAVPIARAGYATQGRGFVVALMDVEPVLFYYDLPTWEADPIEGSEDMGDWLRVYAPGTEFIVLVAKPETTGPLADVQLFRFKYDDALFPGRTA